MESYHGSNSLSSSGYSDNVVRNTREAVNPFAYTTIPPIGRLLDCICEHLSIGGCFRPGNRQLADWLGYASASPIPSLLCQLACLGWISYDPDTRLIMLLRDYQTDQAIRSFDRRSDDLIDRSDDADSALIDPIDRDRAQQNAEYESDPIDRSDPQCMEDYILVAVESDSTTTELKIPCGEKMIDATDQHAADLVMAEYGVFVTLRRQALANRPDLTPQQVRDTYAHFKPAIDAGRCTDRAFFKAIALGEIYPAPSDPASPLDPQSYAADPAYQLGSALPDESARRNALYRDAHWRAVDLLGPGAAFGDMRIVVEALVDGATDEQALAELARELSEARS